MLNLKSTSSLSLRKLRAGSKTFLPILGMVAASAFSAHGQIIWGGLNTITSNSDISLAGTYVDAAGNFAGGGATVDVPYGIDMTTSVVFNGLTLVSGTTSPDSGTYSDGHNITISNITGDNGGDSYDGSAPGVDVYYATAMSGVAYTGDGGTSTGTVTLSSLIPGQLYQVEVWQAHQDGSNVTNTTFMSAGGSNSEETTGLNYILGTFVAGPSDTQSFTFEGTVGEIDTIQLRDLGAAVVPEPSTFALMAAGLGSLAFLVRNRRNHFAPHV